MVKEHTFPFLAQVTCLPVGGAVELRQRDVHVDFELVSFYCSLHEPGHSPTDLSPRQHRWNTLLYLDMFIVNVSTPVTHLDMFIVNVSTPVTHLDMFIVNLSTPVTHLDMFIVNVSTSVTHLDMFIVNVSTLVTHLDMFIVNLRTPVTHRHIKDFGRGERRTCSM